MSTSPKAPVAKPASHTPTPASPRNQPAPETAHPATIPTFSPVVPGLTPGTAFPTPQPPAARHVATPQPQDPALPAGAQNPQRSEDNLPQPGPEVVTPGEDKRNRYEQPPSPVPAKSKVMEK